MINMMMTTFTHEQYSISYVANSSSVFPNVDQSKFSIFCRGPKHLIMLRVVVGENINFSSFAEGVMASQGVQVHLLQDSSCIEMMKSFIKERNDLCRKTSMTFNILS